MPILALGVSYRRATVELLERLAFADDDLTKAYRRAIDDPAIEEAVVLSTCNRVEIYGTVPNYHAGFQALKRLLCESRGVDETQIAEPLYSHYELEAVEHAFSVASGLDSMVLGEPQILGQMKEAARAAESAGTLGSILHRLFQRSFAVAKEVRSTTSIGAASVSMAAAAVKLAARIFPSLKDQSVLLIGAGEMIELAATHFAAQAPARIAVANRTLERAQRLSGRFNAEAMELRSLAEHLHEFDIVVSCTASSLPILGKGLVERALRARRRRPMFMVDLAVPRDIEPEAGELDDVFLYTVDDLAGIVSANLDSRRSALEQAEAIIDGQVGQFMQWMQLRDGVPLIRALREEADVARRLELERALKALGRGEDPAKVVEALSQTLTNKLMHGPTQALSEMLARQKKGQ
jgi:glutamyl-tRNA reductase